MILALVLAGGYLTWQNYVKDSGLEPLYDESYVVVYGVERCPVCKKLRHQLDRTDLEYEWFDLDLTENGWEDFGIRADKAGLPWAAAFRLLRLTEKCFTALTLIRLLKYTIREKTWRTRWKFRFVWC